jgi:hypothetical protein
VRDGWPISSTSSSYVRPLGSGGVVACGPARAELGSGSRSGCAARQASRAREHVFAQRLLWELADAFAISRRRQRACPGAPGSARMRGERISPTAGRSGVGTAGAGDPPSGRSRGSPAGRGWRGTQPVREKRHRAGRQSTLSFSVPAKSRSTPAVSRRLAELRRAHGQHRSPASKQRGGET